MIQRCRRAEGHGQHIPWRMVQRFVKLFEATKSGAVLILLAGNGLKSKS